MRMIKPLALALVAMGVATGSLAQKRVPARMIAPDQWMPASARPYSSQEIYFAPAIYQKIPQIRLTKIEAAYTKGKKGPDGKVIPGVVHMNLSAQAVCESYKDALQKRHHGAAVRFHGCSSDPKHGLAANPGKNFAHATMAVHYHKGPVITENLSVVVTVCEPDEKYDPQQHICVPEDDGKGKAGGNK